MILTPSEWARHKGFSRQYAAKLIKQGTIHLANGKVIRYRWKRVNWPVLMKLKSPWYTPWPLAKRGSLLDPRFGL
jgi:hypothetical protein